MASPHDREWYLGRAGPMERRVDAMVNGRRNLPALSIS
jgi:hypothetical protein